MYSLQLWQELNIAASPVVVAVVDSVVVAVAGVLYLVAVDVVVLVVAACVIAGIAPVVACAVGRREGGSLQACHGTGEAGATVARKK